MYRYIATLLGYSEREGDLAYVVGDLSVTAYATFKISALVQKPDRLIKNDLFDKAGTNKSFYFI
ncbi:DUF4225 domain-containing protein [Enterobacillus tribolii]|nr:DUF4225 domain-containing protein [Enterobacillus tribolii]